jgi:hypothetical protein
MNFASCARYLFGVLFSIVLFSTLFINPLYADTSSCATCPPYRSKTFTGCNTELNPPIYRYDWANNFVCDVKRDYSVFYSTNHLLVFGNFFVAAGILANTNLDLAIRNQWQQNIRSSKTNAVFQPWNTLGSFTFQQLSVYFLAIGAGYWRDRSFAADVIYTWGYRSLRSFLVGTIPQVTLAKVLGAGRPIMNHPSKWQPFKYRMSVSGHTYWGATPFITAAMMVDQPIAKALLYGVSVMPGLARINFDAHYTSQVVLGWSIAYLSCKAVYDSDMMVESDWKVSVFPRNDGIMVGASCEF